MKFTNTRIVYIKNGGNLLFAGNIQGSATTKYTYLQTTGWHIIPNQLFQDFMTYKNWHSLITGCAYFCPKHVKVTIQNLIPLTDDLSIAQDTTFMSFNNTIYALTYQDNIYETHPQQFSNPNVYWREGLSYNDTGGTTKLYLPVYTHRLPASTSTSAMIQAAWDPLVHSHQIGELRPGKNSVGYSWTRNDADNDKWYATTAYFSIDKSYDITDDVTFDNYYTSNYINSPITPGQLYKSYPQNSVLCTKQIVEYKQLWKYPIPNMFIKMVPIYGTKNQLLKHEGQVVITTEIEFDCKGEPPANNMPRYDFATVDITKVFGSQYKPKFAFFQPALAIPTQIGLPPYKTGMETNNKCIPAAAEEEEM